MESTGKSVSSEAPTVSEERQLGQLTMLVREEEDRLIAGRLLDEVVRDVVRRIGPKEAAYQLGISLAFLSNTLAGRENRRIPAHWLPALDAIDPEHAISRFLARRLGMRLVDEPDERTPTQKLQDLTAILNRQGETGTNILRAAGLLRP